MYHVTRDYAEKNFSEIIARAKIEADGVLIVEENKSFLLIDKEELDSWLETQEILKEPTILNDIKQSQIEYKKGETFTMEDVFGLDKE